MTEPPPDWQPPAPGYGAPPPYGAPPAYGYQQPYGYGWPGQTRRTGISILLAVCTFGIYIFVYNYQVHDEMKRYSGRGVGGGIALLLTFVANIAMPFVTPAEVGSLYSLRGERPPVNGWTGLWYLLPFLGGYLVLIIGIFAVVGASATDASGTTTADGVTIFVLLVIYLGLVIGGGITWFVKTNGALNRFWESVGVPAAGSRVA